MIELILCRGNPFILSRGNRFKDKFHEKKNPPLSFYFSFPMSINF